MCTALVLISISVCHSVLPVTPVRIRASCLQSGPWCLRPVCHSGLGPYVLSATWVQVPVSFLSLGSGSLVPVCLPGPDPCILSVARVRDPASCLPTGSVSLHPVCHLGLGRCVLCAARVRVLVSCLPLGSGSPCPGIRIAGCSPPLPVTCPPRAGNMWVSYAHFLRACGKCEKNVIKYVKIM